MLWYLLGFYLLACYVWGLYLLMRLVLGARLRRAVQVRRARAARLHTAPHAGTPMPLDPLLPRARAA